MIEWLQTNWQTAGLIGVGVLIVFGRQLAAIIAAPGPQQGGAVNALKNQFSGVVDAGNKPPAEIIDKHKAVDALDLLQVYGQQSKRGPAYSEALTTISRELLAIGGTT